MEKVRCPECKGGKKVFPGPTSHWSPEEDKEIDCPRCGGTGKIDTPRTIADSINVPSAHPELAFLNPRRV